MIVVNSLHKKVTTYLVVKFVEGIPTIRQLTMVVKLNQLATEMNEHRIRTVIAALNYINIVSY